MLLDALAKAPPQSLHDMRIFFERSRARLEHSLDKGSVSGKAREDYLAEFEEAVTQAQATFLNESLAKAHSGDGEGAGAKTSEAGGLPVKDSKAWTKIPMVWALIAFALVSGLVMGVLLGR